MLEEAGKTLEDGYAGIYIIFGPCIAVILVPTAEVNTSAETYANHI